MENLKNQIEQINKEKTEGSILRSRAMELNSKLDSSFYKHQEKVNYRASHIIQIEIDDGKVLSDQTEILPEIKTFYHNLYTKKEFEYNNENIFI